MSDEATIRLQGNLQKFVDHVEKLQNEEDDSGNGLEKQFRDLRDLSMKHRDENTFPATEGRKPHNIKKNRYKDIIPFDRTRVTLDEIPDEPGSDYINANFIKGLDLEQDYIASQGPLPHTVNDFWRMLWHYDIKVVFMACKLVEIGKKKCEKYWPDEVGSKMIFGDIEVSLIKEENAQSEQSTGNRTTRYLQAEKDGESRGIIQYHYTGWPDHDIPDDIETILDMIAEMRRQRKEFEPVLIKRTPAVIHCSAGCGRTGTICAIDYAWDVLQTGKLDENFNLFNIIKHMREQRQSMIQTPDQYEMVHVAMRQLFQEHLDMIQEHDYGNINFQQESAENSTEVEENNYEARERKGSLKPEIQKTFLNYGIETDSSPSIEDAPLSPVNKLKEIFDHKENIALQPKRPSRNFEKHLGKEPETSVQTESAVEKFENKQAEIQPVKQLKVSQNPPEQTGSYSNVDVGKNEKTFSATSTQTQNKDGKKITTLTIGSVPLTAGTPKRAITLPAQGSIPVVEKGAVSKTKSDAVPRSVDRSVSHDANTYSYAKVDGPQSKKLQSSSDPYSYAVPDNPQGQEYNPNLYSVVNKTQNGAPPDGPLYTPVQKASGSKGVISKGVSEDDPYETVELKGHETEAEPPIPDRGYLETQKPNLNLNSHHQQEQHKDKPRGFLGTLKNQFKSSNVGGSTTSESNDSSSILGFGKRKDKKPKGPRPQPEEWSKVKL